MKTIKYKFWLGHTKKMTHSHTLSEIGKVIPKFTPDILPLQFVGKKDKKGKEIYEGDIFRETIEEDDGDLTYTYIVTWIEEWTMFAALAPHERNDYLAEGISALSRTDYWTFPLDDAENSEVVGNIYEHPHKVIY